MYKVITLINTQQKEKDFNLQYHQKYLNRIGEEVYHKHSSELFKEFKCIMFLDKEQEEADWFHKDDLEEV